MFMNYTFLKRSISLRNVAMYSLIQVFVFITFICPGQQTGSRDSDIHHEVTQNGTTPSDHNTTEQPFIQKHEEPTYIDVKLINGRQPHEGLVLVKPNNSDVWGTVCDDGWDDADATVLCRQLGYKAGLARYPPLFGGENTSTPIYLDDLACKGTESSLLQCEHGPGWGYNNCNHREDAGVQCFVNNQQGSEHVFGYPSVYRQNKDEWKEGVYIPHPKQHLPWGEGTITGWYFYTNSPYPTDVTLQIWRQKSEHNYQLQGETQFSQLTSGFHSVRLFKNEEIKFSAGDVLGIAFPNNNPIPFDSRILPCEDEDGVMYMLGENMLKHNVGSVAYFKKKPEAWSSCRMYSVYATYNGVEYNDSSTFTYGEDIYHVMTNKPLSQPQGNRQCQKLYGHQAQLVVIQSEYEMTFINGALNSLLVAPDKFWIGGRIHQSSNQYHRWAHCQPTQGKECITLQKHYSLEDLASEQFLMFSVECDTTLSYICKISASSSTTVISSTVSSIVKSSRLSPGLSKGAVVSLITVPVVFIAFCILALLIHRWRNKKYQRRGESTVGFVHLEDDKVNGI